MPDLAEILAKWQQILRLQDRTIEVSVERVLENDPACKGVCIDDIPNHAASIGIRSDVAAGEELEETLVHEMLHVAFGPIHQFVTEELMPNLPENMKPLASIVYEHANETVINRVTAALLRLDRK